MATSIDIKSKDGKSVGKHTVSEALAKAAAKTSTVHRTVVAEEANARQGTQSAQTRSQVRGGGRDGVEDSPAALQRAGDGAVDDDRPLLGVVGRGAPRPLSGGGGPGR